MIKLEFTVEQNKQFTKTSNHVTNSIIEQTIPRLTQHQAMNDINSKVGDIQL